MAAEEIQESTSHPSIVELSMNLLHVHLGMALTPSNGAWGLIHPSFSNQ
jgi:hypothetical protein